MNSPGCSISLAEVSVRFAERPEPALEGITLTVRPGERVAIVGPSGCGKTTLLRSLVGAVPFTGEIRIGAEDPSDPTERLRIRRGTGVVRQGADLVGPLSGRLNSLLGITHHLSLLDWVTLLRGKTPGAWVAPLERLALRHDVAHCLDTPAAQLSGGERHRVALVRAVLGRPALLLADEPTTGLDPVSARRVVDDLLATETATLLVTTHDLAVARRFPRKIGIHSGRVLFDSHELSAREIDALYGAVS